MLISLVISGFPFAFLLILSYVTGIDPVLARAAATLGRRPARAVPPHLPAAAAPGLAMSLLPRVRAGVLGVPVGGAAGRAAGPTRVISIAAYEAAFEQYDYSLASAIAMIMGFVQLIIVAAVLALRGACLPRPGRRRKG